MSRRTDLKWFLQHRTRLSKRYPGHWIVVLDREVHGAYESEEDAVGAAVQEFGIDVASVFHATTEDGVLFLG